MFTAEEASALFVGGELVKEFTDASLHGPMTSALEKLRAVLPRDRQDQVARLLGNTLVVGRPRHAAPEAAGQQWLFTVQQGVVLLAGSVDLALEDVVLDRAALQVQHLVLDRVHLAAQQLLLRQRGLVFGADGGLDVADLGGDLPVELVDLRLELQHVREGRLVDAQLVLVLGAELGARFLQGLDDRAG